ncbi:hypothetical protein S7711_00654 [Stachybotrys chartarum IBT 7711]|uniref:N-acetyltransferase domain-containing protein n=1 Tax=Stachybotrys chartarum (strain CBS 109288 / IBT 7711) TaxID=1280523 RepID=A0A084AU07_STACB|nr:hypothetical protein S7711_00654 [Stachybotrys chartarum IBT 7711]KFA47841.1 hypothetical protein S40293_06451 [Stachybotrys chartarum IBT 40293]
MSLPSTASSGKLSQSSLRAFFHPKGPNYVQPPTQSSTAAAKGSPHAELAPSPPPDTASQLPSTSTPGLPTPPALEKLPPEASVRRITPDDINAFRRINALLLPVSYPEAFYQRATDPTTSGPFSRVITWKHDGEEPKVVGGIVCRVEQALEAKGTGQMPHILYIQSLCLLAPYRSKGLISAALEDVVATAIADPNLFLTAVTAHVWTENEEGLKWYEGRGFQREEPIIKGYYIKLRPDSAWHVRRPVSATAQAMSSFRAASTSTPSTGMAALSPAISREKNGISPLSRTSSSQSYQKLRPESEWNDLPADMAPGLLAPPRKTGSEPVSGASSRSSSTARKKKDRSYPAAAFGN